MRLVITTALATALLSVSAMTASAQNATPMYDKMSAKEYGEKFSLEQRKLCLLAIKTYDYGVKELGLDKPDSKRAVRADKALPFVAIELESKTQTKLLFDRAVADVKSEFAVFKAADKKAQKSYFSAAKNPNKTCAKPYDDRKLEGYGSASLAAEFLPPVSSEHALICSNIAISALRADRSAFTTSFLQYVTWSEAYELALRREGYPEDELIETLSIDDIEEKVAELDDSKSLDLYDTCPAQYKKAKFQADLQKNEPAEVPVIDWN